MSKGNVLVLVEGAQQDKKLMERLLATYEIHVGHRIVTYNTNIYALYDATFRNRGGSGVVDVALHLREKEPDPKKKELLSERYSRILMVFDFDPQSTHFSEKSIMELTEYFSDAIGVGQLYLNYPMIEAFFHVKHIPDPDYNEYSASLIELKSKRNNYKARVNNESCISDRGAFFCNRVAVSALIRQNLEKAWLMVFGEIPKDQNPPSQAAILRKQLCKLKTEGCVDVLCACCWYIWEYNPSLLSTDQGENHGCKRC